MKTEISIGIRMYNRISIKTRLIHLQALCLLLMVSIFMYPHSSLALTQVYFSIPDVVEDLYGITFSIESFDNNPLEISWTHNGSKFVADNTTNSANADDSSLHLDNNDFLLAIENTLDIGTRLYICVDIPYPIEQYDCQWDAVDKNNTAYAEFDFFSQSNED